MYFINTNVMVCFLCGLIFYLNNTHAVMSPAEARARTEANQKQTMLGLMQKFNVQHPEQAQKERDAAHAERDQARTERDQARQELEAVQKKLAAATTQQAAAEATQQQLAAELDTLRKQLQAERLKVERLRDAQQEEITHQRAAQETLRTENEQLRQRAQALEDLLGNTEQRRLPAQPARTPAHSNNTLDDYNDGASVISGQTFDSVPEMNDTDDEHDALSSPLITDDDLAAFTGEGRS